MHPDDKDSGILGVLEPGVRDPVSSSLTLASCGIPSLRTTPLHTHCQRAPNALASPTCWVAGLPRNHMRDHSPRESPHLGKPAACPALAPPGGWNTGQDQWSPAGLPGPAPCSNQGRAPSAQDPRLGGGAQRRPSWALPSGPRFQPRDPWGAVPRARLHSGCCLPGPGGFRTCWTAGAGPSSTRLGMGLKESCTGPSQLQLRFFSGRLGCLDSPPHASQGYCGRSKKQSHGHSRCRKGRRRQMGAVGCCRAVDPHINSLLPSSY